MDSGAVDNILTSGSEVDATLSLQAMMMEEWWECKQLRRSGVDPSVSLRLSLSLSFFVSVFVFVFVFVFASGFVFGSNDDAKVVGMQTARGTSMSIFFCLYLLCKSWFLHLSLSLNLPFLHLSLHLS